MKIEVKNKKFSGNQNGFNFVKGIAEVKEGDEAKAKRIASVLGYKIVKETEVKESKAPAKAKAPAKPKGK